MVFYQSKHANLLPVAQEKGVFLTENDIDAEYKAMKEIAELMKLRVK